MRNTGNVKSTGSNTHALCRTRAGPGEAGSQLGPSPRS